MWYIKTLHGIEPGVSRRLYEPQRIIGFSKICSIPANVSAIMGPGSSPSTSDNNKKHILDKSEHRSGSSCWRSPQAWLSLFCHLILSVVVSLVMLVKLMVSLVVSLMETLFFASPTSPRSSPRSSCWSSSQCQLGRESQFGAALMLSSRLMACIWASFPG